MNQKDKWIHRNAAIKAKLYDEPQYLVGPDGYTRIDPDGTVENGDSFEDVEK